MLTLLLYAILRYAATIDIIATLAADKMMLHAYAVFA